MIAQTAYVFVFLSIFSQVLICSDAKSHYGPKGANTPQEDTSKLTHAVNVSQRIQFGTKREDMLPFVALVIATKPDGVKIKCHGILFGVNLFIVPANCVSKSPELTIEMWGKNGQMWHAASSEIEVFYHSHFNENSNANNIAVLRASLNNPVSADPARFQTEYNKETPLLEGLKMTICSATEEEFRAEPQVICAQEETRSDSDCKTYDGFENFDRYTEYCMSAPLGEQSYSCKTDSGAPVIYDGPFEYFINPRVYGMVSYKDNYPYECSPTYIHRFPTPILRTDAYIDFMNSFLPAPPTVATPLPTTANTPISKCQAKRISEEKRLEKLKTNQDVKHK